MVPQRPIVPKPKKLNQSGSKKKPRPGSTRAAILELDDLFRRWIKRLGGCERCSKTTEEGAVLQCAHFIGRAELKTRWHESNAFCFCVGCHFWAHQRPLRFEAWVEEEIGLRAVLELKMLALGGGKPDYPALLDYWRKKVSELED